MTKVAILWHMHQPYYEDLLTGEHILPWVRLHALKDYLGMVALLREFPEVRLTVNVVPSLVVQLEAYADQRARDRHLEVGLKPAAQLTEDDRDFMLANFFHAHAPRMIEPYPRYRELWARRHRAGADRSTLRAGQAFSQADLRDLQIWHKLAWVDPLYLDRDSRVRGLIEKGRGYTESDKSILREVELEILKRVVPEYREAAARGQIELSTSPYYHPILPLLCDTDAYLRTHPDSRMPRRRFEHPEDAAEQLARAVALHERCFGMTPRGLWPSEGSVSNATVSLVGAAGFRWMASDELILSRSLGQALTRDSHDQLDRPELLYRPYVVHVGDRQVACVFRDHALSDLIGFTYAGWDADAAAAHFTGRLREAGRRFGERAGGEEAVVSIILDGENAWEHFAGGGRPFLRALYRRLSGDTELRAVTMSDACAGARERLDGIFPGSWINGDFYIWIGHPDDHRAWGQLADARAALDSVPSGLSEQSARQAREEVLIAEGSDWFWWYGDDHSSAHDLQFDDLFRRHLRNVYRALGAPVPEELFVTNISTGVPAPDVGAPLAFVRPIIDGSITSYFEWLGAAILEVASAAGAMHQASDRRPLVRTIQFGFDLRRLYVRLDFSGRADAMLADRYEVRLEFLAPAGVRLSIRTENGRLTTSVWERRPDGVWTRRDGQPGVVAAAEILEADLPFEVLGVAAGDPMAFFVAVYQGDVEVERYPIHRAIEVEVPAEHFEAFNWTA